jgi:hypothetical protein
MSAAVENSTTTKERSALSTRRLCEALGLGVVAAKNLPYLSIALTEAATQEIDRNPAFRQRIQSLYQQALPPAKVVPPKRPTAPRQPSTRSTGNAPGTPPDLQAIRDHFAPAEWRAKLSKFNKDPLRMAVDQLPENKAGSKPNGKAGKDALVTYLLAYLAHMP